MTIAEAESFYSRDKKEYNLENNRDYANWLESSTSLGYWPCMDIKELQNLINYISSWYEIKYPDRDLDKENGIVRSGTGSLKSITPLMTIDQLLYRLTRDGEVLLNNRYRGMGGYQYLCEHENGFDKWKKNIFLLLSKKTPGRSEPLLFLTADYATGKVCEPLLLEQYIGKFGSTLEDALVAFKKCGGDYDYRILEICLLNHACDNELRKMLVRLIALKLLYSGDTPENGYARAKHFIEEFNNYFKLGMTTDEIDEIINHDYSNDEVQPVVEEAKKPFIRSMFGIRKKQDK